MNVIQSYTAAWANRGFVIPVLLGMRLLSLAIIAPLLGGAIKLALVLSGQAALTDQDIAHFIFSPLGFPIFLGIAGLVLLGTILAFAAITVHQRLSERSGLSDLPRVLGFLGKRGKALLHYAVALVLRVLLIVAPFALIGGVLYALLLGDYDINYYLTARPPEFLILLGIGAVLGAILAWVLVGRLLNWALSLHYVLFAEARPGEAFQRSRDAMQGRRITLLRQLALWYALRLALLAGLGAVAVWLLRVLPTALADGFELRMLLAVGLTSLWAIAGFVVSAIALAALARVLGRYYDGPMAQVSPVARQGLGLAWGLGAGVAALLVIGAMTAVTLSNRVHNTRDVLVIGHRGAAGSFPENTAASIRAAVEAGADWVEIDVQETADGDVVVMHDSDFMKLSQVDLKIWDATRADLDTIDIGSWYDPAFAAERVPTLAEALEITRDRATLLIELKYYGHDEALETRTADIVEAAGMADQVATMSLKYPAVEKMLALRPDWPAGVLAATAVGDLAGLDGDFVAVSSAILTARLVRSAQDAGKQAFVWTVNDPAQMMAMMSLGVDGLITDEPALAREAIARHEALSTAERAFLVFLERFDLLGDTFASASASP